MKGREMCISVILGVILYCGKSVLGDRDICDVSGVTYTYCDDGYYCCDDNTRCCVEGMTAGSLIGVLFGVLFMVTLCVFCAVLVTKKKKFRPHQLVAPSNQQTVPMSTVGRSMVYPEFIANAQGQNYPYGQPYPYGQFMAYGNQQPTAPMQPPPYSQSNDSAYPPPPEYKLEP